MKISGLIVFLLFHMHAFSDHEKFIHFIEVLNGKTVLLVDDEQANLDFYSSLLKKMHCTVVTALTLDTAKHMYDSQRPEAIITDLDLRGRGKWTTKGLTGGLQFIEWLRLKDKDIPILLHSTVFNTAWNRFWFKSVKTKAEALNALVMSKNTSQDMLRIIKSIEATEI